MVSIILPEEYEDKLERIAQSQNLPKDEVVQMILRNFMDNYFTEGSPYELGRDLFGKFGSREGNRSQNYKKLLKEKLREKHGH